jgi:hypothetical protein
MFSAHTLDFGRLIRIANIFTANFMPAVGSRYCGLYRLLFLFANCSKDVFDAICKQFVQILALFFA